MNGAGYFSPRYFGAAFISTRSAPGADQRVYERSSTNLRPKFLARSKVTHAYIALTRASGASNTARKFCEYGALPLCIWRVQLPWQLSLMWPSSRMGHRKSSAALLIVFERNFYCVARTILVLTKNAWVTEKGVTDQRTRIILKGVSFH